MKKVLIILAGMFLLANVSCNNDNDDNDNFDPSASFIGTWQPVSMRLKGMAVQYAQKVPVNETFPILGCESQSRIVLREDGTGTDIEWGNTEQGCEVISSEDYIYTYNKNTKIFTETHSEDVKTLKVTKLTLSEFSYEINVTDYYMGNGIFFTGTISQTSKRVTE